MKKLYTKIITGFREDQYKTIPAEETHKAYHLFLNPEQRGVFSNGVPCVGSDIKDIVPDYNATMGWNPTHRIDTDDWNEIRKAGVDTKLQVLLSQAKQVAQSGDQAKLSQPLRLEERTYKSGLIGGRLDEIKNKLTK